MFFLNKQVAINFAYQPRELEYCLKKVGIKALLVPMSYKNQKYYNMLRNLMPELEKCRPGELLSDCLPNLRAVIMIDNSRLP